MITTVDKTQAMLCHALTGSLPLFLSGLNILKQVTIFIRERVYHLIINTRILRIFLFMILLVLILMPTMSRRL